MKYRLLAVAVCRPVYLEPVPVDKRSVFYGRIDLDKAVEQHLELTKTLEELGVKVYQVEPQPELKLQVYTRDIGVFHSPVAIVSKMRLRVRCKEPFFAEKLARSLGYTVFRAPFPLEGGDVIFLDGDEALVGYGARSSLEGALWLEGALGVRVHPIRVPVNGLPSYPHLDCLVNYIPPDIMVAADLVKEEARKVAESKGYTLITVSNREAYDLATNFVPVRDYKILTSASNPTILRRLEELGVDVVTVEYSEVEKCGGSVRCSTLPVLEDWGEG